MKYRGKFQNGVVVFEMPPPLSDGAEVEVEIEPVKRAGPVPGSPEAIAMLPGWDMEEGELERLLKMVQDERNADAKRLEEQWRKEDESLHS